MSPVVVLTYLSPSFPASDIGSVVPLRMSLPSRPFCPFCPATPAAPVSPLSPFGPFRLPSRSHCPFFLTKMSPVVVLTYLSPSFPVSDVGSLVPLRMSLPSRPFCPFCPFCPAAPVAPTAPSSPLSPFGPLRLPSRSHCPFFLTKMSPVVVLTYLSPSFPVSDIGSLVPLRISLPSRPFCPFSPAAPSSPLSPFVIVGTAVAETDGLVVLFGCVCETRILSPFATGLSNVTVHLPSVTVVVLIVPFGRVTLMVEPFSPLPVIVVAPSIIASTIGSLDNSSPAFATTVALISLLIVLLTSF